MAALVRSRLLIAAVLVAFGAPSIDAQAAESKQEKRKREKAERAEKRREREKRAKERRHRRRAKRREAERQAAKDAAAAAKAGDQALAAKAAEQAAAERAAAEQATDAKLAEQAAKKPTSRDGSTTPAATGAADSGEPGPTESPSDLLSTQLPAAEPTASPPPAAPAPAAPAATITKAAPPPAPRVRTPTWYFALRAGPAFVDRRGYNEYRSNRQIYDDERNLRGELAIGRFISRRLALGVAASGGPFPKFDAPDPLFDENTRYSVLAAQARLDLEWHVGWFVLAIGAGGAYEHAKGTFGYLDPITMVASAHESAFKRFGAIGAGHLGVQMQLGHVGIEWLVGVNAIKLLRGTYEHEMSSPGPSDREMAYGASLLLGLRLQ